MQKLCIVLLELNRSVKHVFLGCKCLHDAYLCGGKKKKEKLVASVAMASWSKHYSSVG